MKPQRLFAVLALLACASTGVQAQSPEPGQLLVAAPALDDPNFGETVFLVLLNDGDGSRAVALNRPTWVSPAEAFPAVGELAAADDTLFFGGPVGSNQLVIVFDAGDSDPPTARRVFGSIYLTTDPGVLSNLAPAADGQPRFRLFAGHAAWAPGQLEAEIAGGNWRTLNASPAQIFGGDPATLWDRLPTTGAGGVSAMLRGPQSFSIE